MAVGYVAKWISLLEAIQHVQRVLGGTLEDARDKLLIGLREGAVTARYYGKDIGGIAAIMRARAAGFPPLGGTKWRQCLTMAASNLPIIPIFPTRDLFAFANGSRLSGATWSDIGRRRRKC
jgi:hypothetical protein